jgi:hypothetical protein
MVLNDGLSWKVEIPNIETTVLSQCNALYQVIHHHLALQPYVSLGLLCYSPPQVSILSFPPSPSFNPRLSQVLLNVLSGHYCCYILSNSVNSLLLEAFPLPGCYAA